MTESRPSHTTVGELGRWMVSHILTGAAIGLAVAMTWVGFTCGLDILIQGIVVGSLIGLGESCMSHFMRTCPAMWLVKE